MHGMNDEKLVDLKETLSFLVTEEPVTLTQEEAIKSYKGEDFGKKKSISSDSDSDDDNSEEEEHLKRIKNQLLESLAKVNKLEKLIFSDKVKKDFKNIKIDNDKIQSSIQKNNISDLDISKQKVIEQMRENMNSDKERSREG